MLVFKSRVVVTLGLISLGTEARGKPRREKSVQIYVSQKYILQIQKNTYTPNFSDYPWEKLIMSLEKFDFFTNFVKAYRIVPTEDGM